MVVTDADRLALKETLVAFANACNDAAVYAEGNGVSHRFALKAALYYPLKRKHGLTASYVSLAVFRVATALKTGKNLTFRPTSADLEDRTLRYIPATESVSIATNSGRRKIALALGDYQRGLLDYWTPGGGNISVDRKGNFYLNFRINLATPAPGGVEPLGVDLGIKRIATLSNGVTFSGRTLNRKRELFARTTASLRRRGTKGAKRTLKRLAGREFRFQRDNNHVISKQIVALAKESDSFLAMENLAGISRRSTNKGRRFNRMIGRWNFYTLRLFIAYKAEAAGVRLVFVNPAYTSKTCPYCGDLGDRKKLHFSCSCGFVGDADKVGAFNIAAQGALTNALKSPIH